MSSSHASLSAPFLEAMSRLVCSVAVVTTDGVAGRAGATVSTLSPVSAEEPPSLLLCLHHKTSVAQKIQENKTFAVNILNDKQRLLAELFAGQRQPQDAQGQDKLGQDKLRQDKFDRTQECWQKSDKDTWRLKDALAFFDCTLTSSLRCQSHIVVIGTVREIAVSEENLSQPLLYAKRSYRMLGDSSPL